MAEEPLENTSNEREAEGAGDYSLLEFFRFALSHPGKEQFDSFSQPVFPGVLRELWSEMFPGQAAPDVKVPSTLGEIEAQYERLFEGPEAVAPLVESHYVKDAPSGAVIQENELFYATFEFEAPKNERADHLLVQLEFVAALSAAAQTAKRDKARESAVHARAEFLKRNVVPWLPVVIRRLRREPPSLYLTLFLLLNAYLRLELEE